MVLSGAAPLGHPGSCNTVTKPNRAEFGTPVVQAFSMASRTQTVETRSGDPDPEENRTPDSRTIYIYISVIATPT